LVRDSDKYFAGNEFLVTLSLELSERWMRHALALAARGRGLVEPNPMVGAVVLDTQGNLVGESWHQRFGEPHAEANALNQAGERARAGTLFVTLEPCCHHGKTPPCTDAVLRSGVSRVVVAMADPFPRVAGGGIAILRNAGIDVEVSVGEAEAMKLNAPYLKLLRTGRPWVHLKWAMSLDGKIATSTSESKWITGDESRSQVHELRRCVDAILIGRGTVAADDPMLTARPPIPRAATRIVLSTSGELPERCQLRSTARETPVLVMTSHSNRGKLAGWEADGCEVLGLLESDNGLSIDAVLEVLGRRRMTNVLVEGGAAVLGAFLDAKAADEVHVYIAPKIIGGTRALSPVGGAGIDRLTDAFSLTDVEISRCGPDIYVQGMVAHSQSEQA